jgi:hypothetical protein
MPVTTYAGRKNTQVTMLLLKKVSQKNSVSKRSKSTRRVKRMKGNKNKREPQPGNLTTMEHEEN